MFYTLLYVLFVNAKDWHVGALGTYFETLVYEHRKEIV